jgi:Family of unknown function (DUF5640)
MKMKIRNALVVCWLVGICAVLLQGCSRGAVPEMVGKWQSSFDLSTTMEFNSNGTGRMGTQEFTWSKIDDTHIQIKGQNKNGTEESQDFAFRVSGDELTLQGKDDIPVQLRRVK